MGKGTSNTSYASFTGRSGSTYYATWTFDVSAIPENATIDSVSCEAKVGVATTSNANVEKPTIQLYSADAAKGEAVVGGNSKTGEVVTLTTGSAWTRDELALCSIRISRYIVTSSDRSVRFYGADLTVVYTYQSEKFMLKLGGAWHDIARVFKKVSGIWVEQTDLANVIEDGVRYKNGGEYVAPKKTVTIKGTGNSSVVYVTINGTKYTSAASVQVSVGDVITATVGGTDSSNSSITVDGTQVVYGKAGSYNYTVQTDCTVTLSYTNDDFFGTRGNITIVST